jgi:steroid delta-isomerase-like uncharacterized protein
LIAAGTWKEFSMPARPVVPMLSRRDSLTHLVGGGLGLLLAAPHLGVSAQEAAPAATPGTLSPLIAQWVAAWNAHDPEQLVALYTPDGVYEEIPTNIVAEGPDAIRAFAEGNFAAFSDLTVRTQAAFAAEEWAVLQAIFAGRYTGQIPGAPAGSGQPFAIPFVSVFRLSDGHIQRNTDYFDNYNFLIHLGILPAPGAATPTT